MQPTDDTTRGDHTVKLPERYRLIDELGQGGMSRVYRVHDDLLQKEVALKILHTDAQADPKKLVGFQREAKITANLKHQNIVSILDFGLTDEGNPYLVMDYVAGESLAEILSRSGRLTVADSLPLIFEILDAVKYAHSQGVLHRDLKPANILLTDNPDEDATVKLIDFGIARFADPNQQDTGSGGIHGTPAYMSPEQARGKNLDQRSEIYSLGCVLFSIWTACPPFEGETAIEVLNQHLEQTPPRLNDAIDKDTTETDQEIPEAVESLIARCLAKNPDDRFQTVAELEAELRKLDEAHSPLATIDGIGSSEENAANRPPPRPSPLILASVALVAVIIVGFTAFVATPNNKDDQNGDTMPVVAPKPGSLGSPRFTAPDPMDVNLGDKWSVETDEATKVRTLAYSPQYELSDSDLKELEGRTDFHKLKLRNHSNFSGTGLRFIRNPKLIIIDLSNAALSEEGWKALSQVEAPIESIDVGQSPTFNSDCIKYLAQMKKLKSVTIPLKRVSPQDIALLSKLTSLHSLTLSGKHPLNPAVVQEIAKIKGLRILEFDGVMLKSGDLAPLHTTKGLNMGLASLDVSPEIMAEIAHLPIVSLSLINIDNLDINEIMLLRASKTLIHVGINQCSKITALDVKTAKPALSHITTIDYVD